MAGSLNKVMLIGRVGKDPEIRNTQGGAKIANFSLATSESWKDRASGERKEKTEWTNIVCFNDNTTAVIERFIKKGSQVYVEGQLQTRDWTDQSGNKRYTTEVVIGKFNGQLTMLDSKRDGDAPSQPAARPQARQSDPEPDGGGMGAAIGDDIPFASCF